MKPIKKYLVSFNSNVNLRPLIVGAAHMEEMIEMLDDMHERFGGDVFMEYKIYCL